MNPYSQVCKPKHSFKKYSPIVLLLIFFFTACDTAPKSNGVKHIDVKQHLNLEVLFTIYNQIWTPFLDEGASEVVLANTRLMKTNYDYFKAFSEHDAIAKTRDFMNRSGTDFFLYAFYYDDFPKATRNREIPEILTKDINPDRQLALEEIDGLMATIADFYIASNFEKFYTQHDYAYDIAREEVLKYIPKNNFISFLENYFGTAYADYDFYCIPFFKTEFGMAHQLQTEKGTKNITFISPFEPAEIDSTGLIKYVGYESEDDILEWVVHEYSHTFFNPSLTQKENMDLLNTFEHLYRPIPSSPQIGNWFSMFAEHLAVAFEVRAAHLLGDEARASVILNRHSDWVYLDHFIAQLEFYENNRDQYPSISDFMPAILNSCTKLK